VPFAPTAKAQNLGTQVKLSWDASGSDNGRPISVVQISVDDGAWTNVGMSGSRTVGDGYKQTHSIKVRAQDSEGQWSPVASDSARTNDPPAEVLRTEKGASGSWPDCGSSSCARVRLTVSNFANPGSYHLACDDGGRWGGSQAQHVPANGSVDLNCYYGYPGNTVRVYIKELDRYATALVWY